MSVLERKLFGIIVAAGKGERLGEDLPKALVPINGESILSHALKRLRNGTPFEQIFVTYQPGWKEKYEESLGLNAEGVTLVEGGDTRQHSVKLALEAVKNCEPLDWDLVLVHDAARCLTERESIARVIKAASDFGAATLALPQVDSLKRVEEGSQMVLETVPRQNLWRIQTPQVFEFQKLFKAHQESHTEATDDASLVEQFEPVYIALGSERNFKVTTPWELKLAELLETADD